MHAPQWILDLIERETHSDTMRALSPLEAQWLDDWREHFEAHHIELFEDAGTLYSRTDEAERTTIDALTSTDADEPVWHVCPHCRQPVMDDDPYCVQCDEYVTPIDADTLGILADADTGRPVRVYANAAGLLCGDYQE